MDRSEQFRPIKLAIPLGISRAVLVTKNWVTLILKTDESGKLQWSLTFGDKDHDIAYSAVQTVEYNFAIAGMTHSHGLGKAAQAQHFLSE